MDPSCLAFFNNLECDLLSVSWCPSQKWPSSRALEEPGSLPWCLQSHKQTNVQPEKVHGNILRLELTIDWREKAFHHCKNALFCCTYKSRIYIFYSPPWTDDKSYLAKSGWLTISTNMVGVPYRKVHLWATTDKMKIHNDHLKELFLLRTQKPYLNRKMTPATDAVYMSCAWMLQLISF